MATELSTEDQPPANADQPSRPGAEPAPAAVIGEGGDDGHIVPGKSVVFATLEVCLCVLVRHLPSLNPAIPKTGFQTRHSGFSDDVHELMSDTLQVLAKLPSLCSLQGQCLPVSSLCDRCFCQYWRIVTLSVTA